MPSQACAAVNSAGARREDAVGRCRDVVRDQDLLAEPDDEAAHALGEVVDADDAARELVGDFAIADDRPGDELRKEQQVERRVDRALLRGRVTAVDVDHVGNRVEGIERDADREQHLGTANGRHVQRGQQRVDVVGEEVGVLEDAEHGEVDGNGGRQPRRFERLGARPRSPCSS